MTSGRDKKTNEIRAIRWLRMLLATPFPGGMVR